MSARPWSRRRFVASLAAGSGAAVLYQSGCGLLHSGMAAAGSDPALLTLREAAGAIRTRTLSSVELTRACLDRVARFNGRLNAFIAVTDEQALADARAAESEVARGRWRGPLHGIPVALKDNVDTAGVRTTAASAAFADRVPVEDAEVVRQLRAAGAVVLGKLNMHEIAMGTTSAVSHFGPVLNPWDPEHVAGGSSGGSAAAVAAGMCFGAVGTDTGGSVRIPAAACGIVGLKPTYGVVSARGVVPLSRLYDHVGPMTRTVADAALMLRAMTDHPIASAFDPDAPPGLSGLRLGVLPTLGTLCDTAASAEVQRAFDAALDVLRPMVAEIRGAELPDPDLGALISAEAYAFHAPTLAAMPERYDPRTRRDALDGRAIPEAEVTRLREALARHRASIGDAFARVDLMLIPTLPEPAVPLREATEPFAQPSCTFAFNTGGLPSLSVPCGFTTSGLPIGLLISGPPFSEPRVLALAQAYERATDWHRRRPPL